jgi:hypothetical protein
MVVRPAVSALAALLFVAIASGGGFSHKRHSELKLACVTCHATAMKSERAGFPKAAVCQGCHEWTPEEIGKIPSQRVYQLRDFMIFSHARHAGKEAAAVECARCHGPVYERDALVAEVEHTMKSCMACHKESKATVACVACHELGQ